MTSVTYIFRGFMAEKAIKNNPKDFLYGYDQLLIPNAIVKCIVAPREPRKGLLRKLTYIVEFPFSLITKLGFPIDIYLLYRNVIKKSDILVCVNDGTGLALLFWRSIGFYKGKVIILAQSLTERLKYFQTFPFAFGFIKKLISRADIVLTLSSRAKEVMQNTFNIDSNKGYIFNFGVDIDFWTPGGQKKTYLLSVGSDMNRDFQTLLAAVPDDVTLKILTKHSLNVDNTNVILLNNQTDEELRDLYRHAIAVIVPSKKVETESSGLSVALQAMACGTPVIISFSPALKDYFSGNQDGTLYYRPEDPQDLHDKIKMLVNNRSLQLSMSTKSVLTARKFTTKKMAIQMKKIISKCFEI